MKKQQSKAKSAESYESSELIKRKNGFTLEVQSLTRVNNATEAFIKAGLDPLVWEVVKVKTGAWDVPVKIGDDDFQLVQCFYIRIECTKIVSVGIEKAVDALAKKACNHFNVKTTPKTPTKRHKQNGKTLVLGLVDQHFGKLAWGAETGQGDYDLAQAESLWDLAIEDTLNDVGYVNRIIIPFGNDIGHIDNKQLTTTWGTPMAAETDSRYEKICDVIERASIRAVNKCLEMAPTKVIHVPGNHSRVTSMWLCRCIHWAFNKNRYVEVDTSKKLTKYEQFGKCLLGFSHGDGPKAKALKDYMTVEVPNEWAKATECREWLTGHLHMQHTTEKISTFEQSGLVYRILPSLCATDAWHFAQGYALSRKATQSFLYLDDWGLDRIIHKSAKRLLS